jgi:hypothetical protein
MDGAMFDEEDADLIEQVSDDDDDENAMEEDGGAAHQNAGAGARGGRRADGAPMDDEPALEGYERYVMLLLRTIVVCVQSIAIA